MRLVRSLFCLVFVLWQQSFTMNLDEDARWLEWVTKQFESIAGDDKEIDIDEFKAALKVKEVRKVWTGM